MKGEGECGAFSFVRVWRLRAHFRSNMKHSRKVVLNRSRVSSTYYNALNRYYFKTAEENTGQNQKRDGEIKNHRLQVTELRFRVSQQDAASTQFFVRQQTNIVSS